MKRRFLSPLTCAEFNAEYYLIRRMFVMKISSVNFYFSASQYRILFYFTVHSHFFMQIKVSNMIESCQHFWSFFWPFSISVENFICSKWLFFQKFASQLQNHSKLMGHKLCILKFYPRINGPLGPETIRSELIQDFLDRRALI